MDSDLKDLDLYVMIGDTRSTTEKKKKHIEQCHPDERSFNSEADQLLSQLSKLSTFLANIETRLDNLILVNYKKIKKTAEKMSEKERHFKKKKHNEKNQLKHSRKEYLILLAKVKAHVNGSVGKDNQYFYLD